MTTNFKPGDRIIMKPGSLSRYRTELGGLTGQVRSIHNDLRHGVDAYFPTKEAYYSVLPEDVEQVLPDYTDDQIHKALAKVKADNNYCSEFDEAVQAAQFMPLMDRLKIIATRKGQYGVYAKLETTLAEMNKPEYQDGDRVHYTKGGEDYVVARIEGTWMWEDHPWAQEKHEGLTTQIQDLLPNPGRTIINTVNLKPGREYTVVDVPEIGRWIEATDAEGNTKTIEVTRAYDLGSVIEIAGSWLLPNNARIDKPGIGGVSKSRGRIVSWKYTTKPWAVGDIVPVGVKVGKDWFGERTDKLNYNLRQQIDKDEHSRFQRVILWIED